ncbi:hypothetical protein [Microcoleus sp. bin38.metabat.b11b12b14.051]|uniref:hypothetical protein n=1 Tax=Microcoleus sp. bin38.metabat.b11b12b14.051 TaxID=2742709 RepID=UPI0025D01331|nr:hypothetical protein [Microcoleus sp. bin38.metabat.b11b12b14.051]
MGTLIAAWDNWGIKLGRSTSSSDGQPTVYDVPGNLANAVLAEEFAPRLQNLGREMWQ